MNLISQATQPVGWSPETITAVIGGLVLLVGAVGSAIAAVIAAWRSNTKATAAQAGNEALQHSVNRLSARQNADAATVATALKEMPPTGRGPSPLLLLPLLLIPFMTGCAFFQNGANEDKVATLEKTFSSAVATLTQLRAQGKIGDTDWANIKGIVEGVNESFISLHNDMDAGKAVDVDAVLRGVRASLAKLDTYRSEAKRGSRHAPVTTHPVGLGRNTGQEQVYRRAA